MDEVTAQTQPRQTGHPIKRIGRLLSPSPLAVTLRALALAALTLLALAPGLFTMPPVDRDESRFAQASRQMLNTGDYAVPRIADTPRLNKPPLIYWLQAASANAINDPAATQGLYAQTKDAAREGGVGAYRVPSVIAALIAVLATFVLTRSMLRNLGTTAELAAVLAAASLALSPIVLWDGRQARADQLLLATTTLTMLALWHCFTTANHPLRTKPTRTARICFWLALTAGVMAKGPITPLVAFTTIIAVSALTHRWRWILRMSWIQGLLVLFTIGGIWVTSVAIDVGLSNYANTIYDEVITRSKTASEGHWGPPGYHLVLLPLLYWPGSLLTAAAVAHLFSRTNPEPTNLFRTVRSLPARLRTNAGLPGCFLLAWILPSWIVFESVSTKLPHYTLPLYPAIAIITARFTAHVLLRHAKLPTDLGAKLGFILWTIIGIAITALFTPFLAITLDAPPLLPIATAILITATLAFALRALLKQRNLWAPVLAGSAAAVLASATLWGHTLPRLQRTWISSQLATAIAAADPNANRPLAMARYKEDSLVFLTNGRATPISVPDIPLYANDNPDALVTLQLRDPDHTPTGPGVIAIVEGFNYNGDGFERVALLDANAAAREAQRILDNLNNPQPAPATDQTNAPAPPQ